MVHRWSEGLADHNMAEDILVELGSSSTATPGGDTSARLSQEILGRLGVAAAGEGFRRGLGWGTTLEALERAGYRVTGAHFARALERLDRPGRELWRWT